MTGLLANQLWNTDAEIVPVEWFPPGARVHMEDLAIIAAALVESMQAALALIDVECADEAREVLTDALKDLDAATRLH